MRPQKHSEQQPKFQRACVFGASEQCQQLSVLLLPATTWQGVAELPSAAVWHPQSASSGHTGSWNANWTRTAKSHYPKHVVGSRFEGWSWILTYFVLNEVFPQGSVRKMLQTSCSLQWSVFWRPCEGNWSKSAPASNEAFLKGWRLSMINSI